MTGATPPDRPRHLVRTALVRAFGRPCWTQYVLWSLAAALEVGILLGLWNLVPILPKAVLPGGKEPILLAFSPDGKTLVTTDDDDELGVGEKLLYVWDVEAKQLRCSIPKAGPFERPWAFTPEGYIAFSPDGKLLAAEVGLREGCAVWQTATGSEVARAAMTEHGKLYIERLEFSPNGQSLMIHCCEYQSGRGTWFEYRVHFLEVASKQVRATFTSDKLASAAFVPDIDLRIPVTEDQKRLIMEAVALVQLDMAGWARTLLLKAAQQRLKRDAEKGE